MPELPEIEILSRQLKEAVIGKNIVEIGCAQPKMLNMPLAEFGKRAIGRIKDVGRRAKSVIVYEDDGSVWLHLGLTAEVRLLPKSEAEPKRVLGFILNDGSEIRMAKVFMGRANFIAQADFESHWNEYGVDPLSAGFTLATLEGITSAKPGSPIKGLLMEQSLVAGIGNLYSDEILRWARISPLRKASALRDDDYAKLLLGCKAVLEEAIAAGGDSDYTDLYGRSGRFEPTVHRQENCRVCGSPVEKAKVQGRTTYYCTKCNPE